MPTHMYNNNERWWFWIVFPCKPNSCCSYKSTWENIFTKFPLLQSRGTTPAWAPRSSERHSVEELKNQLQLQLEVAGLGSWDINGYWPGIYWENYGNILETSSANGSLKRKTKCNLGFAEDGYFSSGKSTTTWEYLRVAWFSRYFSAPEVISLKLVGSPKASVVHGNAWQCYKVVPQDKETIGNHGKMWV